MPMNKIPKLREPRGPIVQEVRDKFIETEYKKFKEEFYEQDIRLIENMDFLLQRYIIMQRKNVDLSVKMVAQVLRWRKEKRLYDMRPEDFPKELALSGAVFIYENDKFGNRTLYLRANMCRSCAELKSAMKDYLTYLLFQVDDCKDGTTFAVIMDLTKTTWSNYDLDLLTHFVSLLKDYFPVNLDYVLAINFPWVLSTAWALVKRLIPSEKRDAVQFINSNKVLDFIPKESCPDFLGGSCKRPYQFFSRDSPNAIDYIIENSVKPVSHKRLHDILNTFRDILPEIHLTKLEKHIDDLKNSVENSKSDNSTGNNNDDGAINNNNNYRRVKELSSLRC